MSDRRDFGRSEGQMREALEHYSRMDLVDLVTHLVRVYVVEGESVSLKMDSAPAGLETMRDLTFSQLVLHLQMNLPHEGLRRLQVSGGRVWVEQDGVEVVLTTPQQPESPPDAQMIEREDGPVSAREAFGERNVRSRPRAERAVTGPVVSEESTVGSAAPLGAPRARARAAERSDVTTAREAGRVERPSVGLRGQDSAMAPVRGPAASRAQESSVPARQAEEDDGSEGTGEVSDRFSMLELD